MIRFILSNLYCFLLLLTNCSNEPKISKIDKSQYNKIIGYIKTNYTRFELLPHFPKNENIKVKISQTKDVFVLGQIKHRCKKNKKFADKFTIIYPNEKMRFCDFIQNINENEFIEKDLINPALKQLSDDGKKDLLIMFIRITDKIVGVSIVENYNKNHELSDTPGQIGSPGWWNGKRVTCLIFGFTEINSECILIDDEGWVIFN